MILSRKHQFVFIRTQKTAGSSIEMALSKFCGENDIITPDDRDLRVRLGYPTQQNCGYESFHHYSLKDWFRLIRRGRRKFKFHNHMSAHEVKKKAGDKTWNTFFSFCFERIPYDKVISYYYFKYRDGPRLGLFRGPIPSLSKFIQSEKIFHISDWELYAIDGEIAVDRVCRYEDLECELATICEKLNLPTVLELPEAKRGVRKDRRPYREVLTEADKERIDTVFSREIEYFGYTY